MKMLDINLTGHLWGMPVSLIGQATLANSISSIPTNLTIVNQTTPTDTWIIAAIGAFGAIFGALAGGLATYIIERLRIKNMDCQRRQQAYSQLYGRKLAYVQCYVSYFMNFIALEKSLALMDFGLRNPERVAINGTEYLTSSIEFDHELSGALIAKSDEFALRLAQSRQDLWEVIGLVKLLFTNTDDLIRDIKILDDTFETFEEEIKTDRERDLIEFRYELLPHTRLNITTSWPETKETSLKNNYINRLDEKFNNLLNYLENEIKRELEDAKKKHWWQLWK